MSRRRGRRSRKQEEWARKREQGFDLSSQRAKLPDYNALYDRNLRHHFENRVRQKQLHRMGLIDNEGKVINLAKNRSKLFIIEQEFKAAEKAEYWRMKEEQEMRRRVQKKRYEALEQARRDERLAKIKEDRRIRREISAISHNPIKYPSVRSQRPKANSSIEQIRADRRAGSRRSLQSAGQDSVGSRGSFFITEGGGDSGRDR
jgi:hypothetical protein